MAVKELTTFPITIKEACKIFGKSKRQVQWAIWRDNIKARQCLLSSSWILDYNSCVEFWGNPLESALVAEVRMDWHD